MKTLEKAEMLERSKVGAARAVCIDIQHMGQ